MSPTCRLGDLHRRGQLAVEHGLLEVGLAPQGDELVDRQPVDDGPAPDDLELVDRHALDVGVPLRRQAAQRRQAVGRQHLARVLEVGLVPVRAVAVLGVDEQQLGRGGAVGGGGDAGGQGRRLHPGAGRTDVRLGVAGPRCSRRGQGGRQHPQSRHALRSPRRPSITQLGGAAPWGEWRVNFRVPREAGRSVAGPRRAAFRSGMLRLGRRGRMRRGLAGAGGGWTQGGAGPMCGSVSPARAARAAAGAAANTRRRDMHPDAPPAPHTQLGRGAPWADGG